MVTVQEILLLRVWIKNFALVWLAKDPRLARDILDPAKDL